MTTRTRTQPAAAPPADAPRLTRDDWLAAAHAAVVEGGFDQLRVLLIAKALGVTRGSFYWHFSDHAELQAELLAGWRQRQLASLQRLQAPVSDDPQLELERVLDAALAHAGADLEHMRFELALRGLGRRDAGVALLLAEVDAQRLQLFEQKFQQLLGDRAMASDLARLFYLAVVGSHQALARPGNPPQLKGQLKRLIGTYLVARQAPPAATAPAATRRRARA
jgi:AcrR family transcriptional regulator